MSLRFLVWFMFLGLISLGCVAARPSSGTGVEPGDDPEPTEEPTEEPEDEEKDANVPLVILLILTVIVVISVVFEKGKEHLIYSVEKNIRPIVISLFGEMTLLGFIGLVLFVVVKSNILGRLSDEIFGEEDRLEELVELVHIAIFGVMVLFLAYVVALTRIGKYLTVKWRGFERSVGKEEQTIQQYAASNKINRGAIREVISYLSLRHRFITGKARTTSAEVRKVESQMGKYFDFGEYLGMALGEALAEIVEVSEMGRG